MNVKIDTREKLHVITIHEPDLAANMTEKMDKVLVSLLDSDNKNVIINMEDIQNVESAAAEHLLKLQELFYGNQASFVICNLRSPLKKSFGEAGLLAKFNYTPTESEAMDIVQMEEIERELGEI